MDAMLEEKNESIREAILEAKKEAIMEFILEEKPSIKKEITPDTKRKQALVPKRK